MADSIKTWMPFAAVFVFAYCAAYQAHAAEIENVFEESLFSPADVLRHADDLKLDKETRDHIVKLTRDTRRRADQLKVERDREFTRLNGLLSREETSQEDAQESAGKVFELENEIKLLHLELLVEIKASLNDEQIAKLKDIRMGGGTAEIPDEDIYPLEKFTVSAAVKREMAFRAIRLGLSRSRSDKSADADKLVCHYDKPVGSHIRQIFCATNRTWSYWGQHQTGRIFGLRFANLPPYIAAPDEIVTIKGISRMELEQRIAEITEDDSDAANEKFLQDYLMAEAIGIRRSQRGHEIDALVQFVRAYRQVSTIQEELDVDLRITKDEMEKARLREAADNQMAMAITAIGMAIDTYNNIATEVEEDKTLKDAVLRALDVTI